MHPATLDFQICLSAAEEDPFTFAVNLQVELKFEVQGITLSDQSQEKLDHKLSASH